MTQVYLFPDHKKFQHEGQSDNLYKRFIFVITNNPICRLIGSELFYKELCF